jgi:hypothetical protein
MQKSKKTHPRAQTERERDQKSTYAHPHPENDAQTEIEQMARKQTKCTGSSSSHRDAPDKQTAIKGKHTQKYTAETAETHFLPPPTHEQFPTQTGTHRKERGKKDREREREPSTHTS